MWFLRCLKLAKVNFKCLHILLPKKMYAYSSEYTLHFSQNNLLQSYRGWMGIHIFHILSLNQNLWDVHSLWLDSYHLFWFCSYFYSNAKVVSPLTRLQWGSMKTSLQILNKRQCTQLKHFWHLLSDLLMSFFLFWFFEKDCTPYILMKDKDNILNPLNNNPTHFYLFTTLPHACRVHFEPNFYIDCFSKISMV